MVFSFYYTEQISSLVLNKNPLMITIMEESYSYNVTSVNAEINGNTIIPGINGLKVNNRESFYKMQAEDVFNQYYLIFDEVPPIISLEDNKDKIIVMGNKKLKKVSFILEEENEVSDYFKSYDLKASLLTNLENYHQENFFEVINNEVDGFKSLENTLNLNKENTNICVVNDKNKDICLKSKKYLVDPTLKFNSSNLVQIKKSINNGSIIFVSKNVSLSDMKIILKEVSFKDLEPVYLSEIISEENKIN